MTYRLFATWMLFLCFVTCASAQTVNYEQALDQVGQTLGARLSTSSQKAATVLDFTNLDGMATQLGRLVTQDLTDRLVTTVPTISWIDRSQRDFILKENKLAADRLLDPTTRKQLGRLMGVDTIVVGTLTALGKEMRLQARSIDIETARVLAVASTTFLIPDSMSSLADRSVSGGVLGQGNEDSSSNSVFRNHVLSVRAKRLYADSGPGKMNSIKMSIEIENVSGEDIWVGIFSAAVEACKFGMYGGDNTAGIAFLPDRYSLNSINQFSRDERRARFTALPAGSKTLFMASSGCGNDAISSRRTIPFVADIFVDLKGKLQRLSVGIPEFPIDSN